MAFKDQTDLRNHQEHLADHLAQVNRTGKPMFIQDDGGKTQGVVLSSEQYASLCDDAEMMQSLRGIDQSMRDIKAGRTRPFREAIDEMIADFETPRDD